jgi:enterochelin esterase-like enzyme
MTRAPYIWAMTALSAPYAIHTESRIYPSAFLRRNVRLDCYLPDHVTHPSSLRLLLFNDGQDLEAMGFAALLEEMGGSSSFHPLLCVGIHASHDRLHEYGTAQSSDYSGRGSKAFLYTHFIIQELLPFLEQQYQVPSFAERAFAGFSLGGLSAMDIVWNHPKLFRTAGVFSASLWWRSKSYEGGYDEQTDRIMHAQVAQGRSFLTNGHLRQRFFFQCGTEDETADRNGNGVIDSIDDTLDLISALRQQGIPPSSIHYLEIPQGRHDKATWALALPTFLRWGWITQEV